MIMEEQMISSIILAHVTPTKNTILSVMQIIIRQIVS